jgi:hypothetical protein
MYDSFDVCILLEDGKSVIEIAEINFIVLNFLPGYFLYPFQHAGMRPGIVVNRYHIIPVFYKINYCMRADIAATSGYENFNHEYRFNSGKNREKKTDDLEK